MSRLLSWFKNVGSEFLFLVLICSCLSPVQASRSQNIRGNILINIRRRFFPNVSLRRNPCRTTFKLKWDGSSLPSLDDCGELFECRTPLRFNHDFVGITHPLSCHPDIQLASNNIDIDRPHIEDTQRQHIHSQNKDGQVLRKIHLRKKVGSGRLLYNNLRNAIINWEDTLANSTSFGIRAIGSPRFMIGRQEEDVFSPSLLPPSVSKNVMQIWNSGGKRLVTFSRVFGSRFLFCMNPCMVVYESVDVPHHQRNIDMTYTSTAYATLKGHMLAGEERVTVAIRNKHKSELSKYSGGYGIKSSQVLAASSSSSTGSLANAYDELEEDEDVYVEILSLSRPSSPGIFGKIMFNSISKMQTRFFQEQLDTLQRIADIGSSTDK